LKLRVWLLAILATDTLHSTCPHGSSIGGFSAVDWSFDTGHAKMEWNTNSCGNEGRNQINCVMHGSIGGLSNLDWSFDTMHAKMEWHTDSCGKEGGNQINCVMHGSSIGGLSTVDWSFDTCHAMDGLEHKLLPRKEGSRSVR